MSAAMLLGFDIHRCSYIGIKLSSIAHRQLVAPILRIASRLWKDVFTVVIDYWVYCRISSTNEELSPVKISVSLPLLFSLLSCPYFFPRPPVKLSHALSLLQRRRPFSAQELFSTIAGLDIERPSN